MSYATGAVPETVPAEAGRLVPVGDDAAVADALRTLLTDNAARESRAAASAAAGRDLPSWFDTCAVAQRVLENL